MTGGTSGIGYGTAKLLKSKGATVVICGRNEVSVRKVENELNVFGIVTDVSDESDVEESFLILH